MSAQFLTVRQTAEYLNICYQTVFRKVSKKEIPSMRMGRKILVPLAFIESLVNKTMSGVCGSQKDGGK